MDEICSFLALVVLIVPFVIIGIIIKCTSKGPIFFKQKRVGKNKKIFYIHKFRTMYTDTPKDVPTHLLNNPERFITKIGAILRKTSLDELPQVWDVFCGKMSVIGPRPALYNQYDLIEERDKYGVNAYRPGISGYAQIHGRDELEIEVKAKLDGYYVEHYGLWMDIKCFFGTFFKVFKHEGFVEGGTGEIRKVQTESSLAENELTNKAVTSDKQDLTTTEEENQNEKQTSKENDGEKK